MPRIPLEDVEQILTYGWINVDAIDMSRLIQPGQVVTIILSDATFTVPDTVGTANVLGSKQREFTNKGLVKIRAVERQF